ncbi:SET and MYND domain-containing protein 5-like [Plakobranchus ocellatus]|uniref:SET and MYND domain-containing protein 5-like n=1 Tax=Plakobranchus ocellatus TaxID=259542 RepID=A0AAV3YA47_9GAST|nr:SET and MYND domain-containing protein 5-like [Plakobranchus ocellatus]
MFLPVSARKGEEIFITYIDTTVPKLLRKAWLYKSFNFWCNCLRCQFEGDQPTECSNCLKKAEEPKQFPACSKCKRAWYCGVKCQREAWKKGHKVICNAPHSQVTVPTEMVSLSQLFT